MENQQQRDILVFNKHDTGWSITMPEETKQKVTGNIPEPEWITITQAIEHPDCPVSSRQTLHNMIARGDVPEQCIDRRPLGKDGREIVYLDANCLRTLPYKQHGERGVNKKH